LSAAATAARLVRWRAGLRGFLFIAGHQHSYSTLLAHILGTSPEIAGYREHHLAYRSPAGLWVLCRRLAEEFPDKQPSWLMDKLLHDAYRLSPWLLNAIPCRLILLLRRPAPYLASSLNLQRIVHGPAHPIGPEYLAKGRAHYSARLRTLAELARRVRRPKYFLAAERLAGDTTHVLEELRHFLSLRQPLSPDYQLFAHTGQRGHGDPSEVIRAGHVVHEPAAHSFQIPPVPDLEEAYQKTAALLRACCLKPGPGP